MAVPPETVLHHVAAATWEVTRAAGDMQESCCIAASFIAREALRYFGIAAEPEPVSVVVHNAASADAIGKGFTPEHPAWPVNAWSLGVHPDDGQEEGPGRFRGHLVLRAAYGDTRWLVDASAPQFTRPRKNLHVDTFVGATPLDWDEEGGGAFITEQGVVMIYQPWPGNDRWRQSPDWRHGAKRYRRHIGHVIRAVRQIVEAA